MIQYIKRKNLNVEKYNARIENSVQSRVYAFSWYLDIVAENWDVLVIGDYEAVMPIGWRRKMFIKYVYPPFWLLELGVFSLDESLNTEPFFTYLFDKFRFVETRLNTNNIIKNEKGFYSKKEMQILNLNNDYNTVFKGYRKDRRKDLNKANKLDLVEKWNDTPEALIELFKNNVGKRTPNILENDYNVLLNLIKKCIEKRAGDILSVYDTDSNLVASGFFLKHKKIVTLLVSSTDFKNRKNGANTFLIDRAIFRYEKNFQVFNFGGSSIVTIAKYFLSFGAETINYHQVKYNNLPFLLKIFKR